MNFKIELSEEQLNRPISVQALSLFISAINTVYRRYINNIAGLCVILTITILCQIYLRLNIAIPIYFIIILLLLINIFELFKLNTFLSISRSQHIIYTKIYMDHVLSFLNSYQSNDKCKILMQYIRDRYSNINISNITNGS